MREEGKREESRTEGQRASQEDTQSKWLSYTGKGSWSEESEVRGWRSLVRFGAARLIL